MRPARYHSGPLAWCLILGATCLLLFLFQKILWLVVPFVFALIIYYLLFPLLQRLVLRGLSRNTSAAVVSISASAVVGAVAVFSTPWVVAQLAGWQTSGTRYIEGGLRLVAETLVWMEHNFSLVAKARLSDQLMQQISGLGDKFVSDYLPDIAFTLAAWTPSLLLAPFLAFFFLRDGWRLAISS